MLFRLFAMRLHKVNLGSGNGLSLLRGIYTYIGGGRAVAGEKLDTTEPIECIHLHMHLHI